MFNDKRFSKVKNDISILLSHVSFVNDSESSEKFNISRVLPRNLLEVCFLSLPDTSLSGLKLRAIFKVGRLVKEFGPDLVIAHRYKPFFIVTMLIMRQIDRTRVGKTIVGVRDAEDLSEAIGVPTVAYRLFAFVFAAFLAGFFAKELLQFV